MEDVSQEEVVFLVLDLNQKYQFFKRSPLKILITQTDPHKKLTLARTPIPEFLSFLARTLLVEEGERTPKLRDVLKLSDCW